MANGHEKRFVDLSHVLEPDTGLHRNVWVFDFKSLYPSIIRTFNIDPMSYIAEPAQQDLIRTPGGAFRREPAILPQLLDVKDLPPLPEGYVYEVWLIGDGNPVPAGVFANATAQHAIAADRSQFNTLAITMEPGPMGTEAPTSDVYATASL